MRTKSSFSTRFEPLLGGGGGGGGAVAAKELLRVLRSLRLSGLIHRKFYFRVKFSRDFLCTHHFGALVYERTRGCYGLSISAQTRVAVASEKWSRVQRLGSSSGGVTAEVV